MVPVQFQFAKRILADELALSVKLEEFKSLLYVVQFKPMDC